MKMVTYTEKGEGDGKEAILRISLYRVFIWNIVSGLHIHRKWHSN